MVQVDVFWAYGLGATLAAASAHIALKKPNPFESSYFVKSILFLALIWAPTGMFLLLRHPSWETMQAASSLSDVPNWLIIAFGITNVTQGVLGYYVGVKLIEKGRTYLAQINWMAGYIGMFFILVYGWDGLGYDRFLYDRDMTSQLVAWTPYAGTGDSFVSGVFNFFTSSVFITLLIDGVFLIPGIILLSVPWIKESKLLKTQQSISTAHILTNYFISVFVFATGTALLCAGSVALFAHLLNAGDVIQHSWGWAPENLTMHWLSYLLGLPIGLAVSWLLLLNGKSAGSRFIKVIDISH
jgi:hypothetical protein